MQLAKREEVITQPALKLNIPSCKHSNFALFQNFQLSTINQKFEISACNSFMGYRTIAISEFVKF